MKRIFMGFIVVVMILQMVFVSASDMTFTDVSEGDWYYSQVMAMTERGLFRGKGDNMFCPDDTITEAEFLTVIMRALYPDEDLNAKEGEEWWQPAYNLAIEKGVVKRENYEGTSVGTISGAKFNVNTMSATIPIKRKQMAVLTVKALKASGETELQPYTYIPDLKEANELYRESIQLAYGAGLLVGDNEGFFRPEGTLTRAEASTVLYRIIEPTARVKIDFDSYVPITIYEGQQRTSRNAQEGDTFVKADGTKIVLKKGPNGILGEGQCVAPDVNFFMYSVKTERGNWMYNPDLRESLYDSTGNHLHNQDYRINNSTGEGHWSKEIQALCEAYPEPDRDGAYPGEISDDPYKLWVWDFGMWTWNFEIYKSRIQ